MRRLFRVSSSFVCLTVLCTVAAAPAFAQAPSSPQTPPPASLTLTEGLKRAWASIERNVRESANKVSDADYAFKPTPDVRSFGEMIGHIAISQFSYCSAMRGETNPKTQAEMDKLTTKADLIKALEDSNTYCDASYATLTDASLTEMVKNGPRELARGVLTAANIAHSNEHYGNLVTYMRLKGIVPPSTERSQPAPKKPSQE
jgi:uncharacterized damage-inducible protein DinB